MILTLTWLDGFEMMHKALCSIEQVPYCFLRSFIKFQGHTGWLIDDLNPIWIRLIGRSQLSNPSDLPCWNFGTILSYWNGSKLGFPGISQRTHGGNSLKFCMLMYLDHHQNWLVFGHTLLIFLILALFWLSEAGQIWGFQAFSGEPIEKIAINFACWCILITFRIGQFMVTVYWFFWYWRYFDLVKWVKFAVSRHFLKNPLVCYSAC